MSLLLHTYRYGKARPRPGLSIGVTRHPPRGVPKAEYASRGYFQVWLPMLGPSAPLLAAIREGSISFETFARRYRVEMNRPEPRQVIRLLAFLARHERINLGCYCADASRCHRTLLAELIGEVRSEETDAPAPGSFASPACSMPEIED
jgi:uncharacterized protein YeaO (DUF488 family)